MLSENCSIIIVGHQGSGKSLLANRIALAYPRRVLVISPDDRETIFRKYPDLFEKTDNRIQRVIYEPRLQRGLLKYKDGLLIFDDSAYYLKKINPEFWRELLIRKRQHNRDIIFVCHSIRDFPPQLMQYINGVHILPFIETDKNIKDRIYNWQDFMKVWHEVNQTQIPKYFPIFA